MSKPLLSIQTENLSPQGRKCSGQQRSPMRYEVKVIQNYSYNLEDRIGRGQFSTVYLGKEIATKMPVAVKVIEVQKVNSDIFLSLLQNEIEILKMCKHQNLLKLHEVYNTPNNIYIVTEFCNQGDLHGYIEKTGGLSQEEAMNIFKHLLLGLREMQQKCVIHRDIKPANILISNCTPKFADFGFSVCKYVPSNNLGSYNVGTPLYMSPESLLKNQYSFKSDIWALGIVLFEMLYGRPPFYSPTEQELKVKLQEYSQSGQIKLPKRQVSKEILNLISGMLIWDPSKRWSLQYILSLDYIFNKDFRQLSPFLNTTISNQSKESTIRGIDCEVPDEDKPQRPMVSPTVIQRERQERKYLDEQSQQFDQRSKRISLTQPPQQVKSDHKVEAYRLFVEKTIDLLAFDSNNLSGSARLENLKIKFCLLKLFSMKVTPKTYESIWVNSRFQQIVQNPDFSRACKTDDLYFRKILNYPDQNETLEFYRSFEQILKAKLKPLVQQFNEKMKSQIQKHVVRSFQLQMQLIQYLVMVALILKSNGADFKIYGNTQGDKFSQNDWGPIYSAYVQLNF